jgi:hypothetical protein
MIAKKQKKFGLLFSLFILVAFLPATAVALVGEAVKHDYHYTGSLNINPDTGQIQADWLITVFDKNETSITFFLRHTLSDIEVSGAGAEGAEIEQLPGPEGFWAVKVSLTELADNAADSDREINISYAGVLIPEPMDNLINAIEPGRVELNVDSFWFPIDSRFTKFITADLAVHIGEGWQGVTTGEAIAIRDGFRIVNTDPRIDIAFSLSKSFHITQLDGFTIYDQRDQYEGVDRLVATANQCRSFLDDKFGSTDPLPVAKLLIAERPSSGYARENYIVFTDISETKPAPLTRFVCHEFAHYWSRGARFDTVDNWINEAVAEYLGLMAVREYLGQGRYDEMLVSFASQIAEESLPPIWKQGDTERTSYLVQYRKGPLVLAQLENNVGKADFLEIIQKYFNSSQKTTEGLIATVASVAGPDQAAKFEVMLGE